MNWNVQATLQNWLILSMRISIQMNHLPRNLVLFFQDIPFLMVFVVEASRSIMTAGYLQNPRGLYTYGHKKLWDHKLCFVGEVSF